MSDDELPVSGFPENVVEVKFGGCGHYGRLLFNDKEEFLTCGDCGAQITMREGMQRIMNSERRFQQNWARNKLLTEELEKKRACKCQHCGRMTKIRSEVTDSQVMDLLYEKRLKEKKP